MYGSYFFKAHIWDIVQRIVTKITLNFHPNLPLIQYVKFVQHMYISLPPHVWINLGQYNN